MIIIPNSITIYILGEFVNIGCFCFHISQLEKVAAEHNITHKQIDIIKAYEQNKICNDEDHLDLFVKALNHSIRMLVCQYGRDQDLDILVNDVDTAVLHAVIAKRRPKDLDVLVKHPSQYVRYRVATLNIPEYLNVLKDDESRMIRLKVQKLLKS